MRIFQKQDLQLYQYKMDITQTFKLQNKGETVNYLTSRGFSLFKSLEPSLISEQDRQSVSSEGQVTVRLIEDDAIKFGKRNHEDGENFFVNEKIINGEDYRQYEVHTILECPSSQQLQELERDAKILSFKPLISLLNDERIGFDKVNFGFKLGCKLSQPHLKWVEKWAHFEVGSGDETLASTIIDTNLNSVEETTQYKYFSKFWYENQTTVKSEAKLQSLNHEALLKSEIVERCTVQLSGDGEPTMSEILSFNTQFGSECQKIQEFGVQHSLTSIDGLKLEFWQTDYTNNTYQKESQLRSLDTESLLNGQREGRNEFGELWSEKWFVRADGTQDGWSREMTKDEGHTCVKSGEGQESSSNASENSIKRFRWQEKHERANNDYWEKAYEEETSILTKVKDQKADRRIKQGLKEFKNNRGYTFSEDWSETQSGIILVQRVKDDGLGTKTTENFKAQRSSEGSHTFEVSDDIIEDVANNKKIIVNRGKKLDSILQDEWENTRIIDFKENFETIKNRGQNCFGSWQESWYDKDNGKVKWASKQGEQYLTGDKWQEEWTERQKEEGVEKVCRKWGKNLERNEEWTEQWGEQIGGDKSEKWTDRWVTNLSTGVIRGENWGHQYDGEMKPVHHWVEQWDSQGNMIKRVENF
ncbi:hypothetical protein FGO68_gene4094 [Halteria grandinella]|uniref:Uncharacterized protein n=1 Tax=Halteria grandinella TaxID=5974 RepID=A0A8J8T4K9_HALGN|nr:hypothetical protein FGO68_gene4094 [Halteria grandinella]